MGLFQKDNIYCCDVLEGLRKIEDNSVHLIVSSPPYNCRVAYDQCSDDLPHLEYLSWMKEVWSECKRVLVSGGRLCINCDSTTNLSDEVKERSHPLNVDFTNQLRDLGYIYRCEIIWCKQNAPSAGSQWGSYCLPSSPHVRRNHEHVVTASKDSLKLEGNSMMSDISRDEFLEYTLSTWNITPENRKINHPAAFPRELPKRLIKLFSFVGNTVLDPFSGSGTVPVTAAELGRHYIGIDISEKYCEHARAELLKVQSHYPCEAKDGWRTYGNYSWIPSPIQNKLRQVKLEDTNKFPFEES